MKSYSTIIFDLDGVIIDQSIGITESVKYALLKFGIEEKNNDTLLSFIGPNLKSSFMRVYGFDEKKAMEAVGYYRETYKLKGIYEFKVYEGIASMLSTLSKEGKKLFVATTKPKAFAETVLKHANIDSYFNFIHGDTMSYDVTKAKMIKMILDTLENNDFSNVVMVGDRDSDIYAAKENKIDSIGVTYGFGTVDELRRANATMIVNSVSELKERLR